MRVSSSSSGNEEVVSVQPVRAARRADVSGSPSVGCVSCGGASGWLPKKEASIASQPSPLRMPVSRAVVTFTYMCPYRKQAAGKASGSRFASATEMAPISA